MSAKAKVAFLSFQWDEVRERLFHSVNGSISCTLKIYLQSKNEFEKPIVLGNTDKNQRINICSAILDDFTSFLVLAMKPYRAKLHLISLPRWLIIVPFSAHSACVAACEHKS